MTKDRETLETLEALGMAGVLAEFNDDWLPEEIPDAQGLPPPINWHKIVQEAREAYPQNVAE